MKTITKEQYYQLIGVVVLAKSYLDKINDLEKAALNITQEVYDIGGHTSDIVWGSRDLDEGLKIMGVKVNK